MDKRKIEKIDIDLGMDIESEIKAHTDVPVVVNIGANIPTKYIKHTKKQHDKLLWKERLAGTVNFLTKQEIPVTKAKLIEVAGVDPSQFGALIIRIRNYLRHDDKWSLVVAGTGVNKKYKLIRFGE